jgi:hypothetical protein
MRFTFVILLFCGLGADAQMIIKAHANYRPYAVAVAQNPLLDDYPNAAAAYSLRKLRTAYTGSAIRVRRSNDNTEQDIGFTAGGDLDTASLKTFVGANNGFVTTWYDQSGNARNATQTTAGSQPRIVNTGTIERVNNKPCIRTTALNSSQGLTTGFSTLQNLPVTISCVYKINTLASNAFSNATAIIAGNGATVNFNSRYVILVNSSNHIIQRRLTSGANSLTLDVYSTDQKSIIGIYRTDSLYANMNSTNYGGLVLSGTAYNTTSTFQLFRSSEITFNGNVSIQEAIIWLSDFYTDRNLIQATINSYYGIY